MLGVNRSDYQRIHVGDSIIYVVTKFGANPGSRAERVRPQIGGDLCSYTIEKYWRVTGETADGGLIAKTRTGKEHVLKRNDPNLRRPSWWKRILHHSRFPTTSATAGSLDRINGVTID